MLAAMNGTTLTLFSDLHLDQWRWAGRPKVQGLAILAGDVMEAGSDSPVAWAKARLPGGPVVFVPGNHDFYGGRMGPMLSRWRQQALGSNVHALYNQTLDYEGMRILGTTLWSGLALDGPVAGALLAKNLRYRIADFSCMYDHDGSAWTVARMLEEHEKALAFLRLELARDPDVPKIVVTHWPPTRGSLHPRFANDALSPYFINDYPDLVAQAALWLHGHTHDDCDYRVGEDPRFGRVICAPRGYAFEGNLGYKGRVIPVGPGGQTEP